MRVVVAVSMLVASLILSGCFPSDDERTIARAKAKVADEFKDPESVQFRNLRIVKPGPEWEWYICGEANGKMDLVDMQDTHAFTFGLKVGMQIRNSQWQ